VTAATVLLLVGSTVRYFGTSAGSDSVGQWLFWGAVAVGAIGCLVSAAEWRARRRRISGDDELGSTP
jgi:hypothetical protein